MDGDHSKRVIALGIWTVHCPGMVLVLEMVIITFVWRINVLEMLTILGIMAVLRRVLVLRMVNALMIVRAAIWTIYVV